VFSEAQLQFQPWLNILNAGNLPVVLVVISKDGADRPGNGSYESDSKPSANS
jgi:hypothetical protein